MSLRSFISHNFWLKIFSLILASLIWFAMQSNQSLFAPRRKTREFRCPVGLLTPPGPGSRPLYGLEPGAVIVKVRGDEGALRKLDPTTILAYVRLPEVTTLTRSLRVEVVVPREVTLEEVAPDQVSLQTVKPAN